MKKAILAIAMLFSVVMYGQKDITGIWVQDEGSAYYTVILLNNQQEGYQFLNFSFVEQDVVNEKVISVTSDTVVTKVNNPDNGWSLQCVYSYVDDYTLKVEYTGDYVGTDYLKRKHIK